MATTESVPSAVDVVSPAMRHTRAQLLPFQWSQWWRLVVLGVLAGEFLSGNFGGSGTRPSADGAGGAGFGTIEWPFVALIAVGSAMVVFVLLVVLTYISSVFRFALIEAVVRRRTDGIRAGWRKWRAAGSRLFDWAIRFLLIALLAIVVPILAAAGAAAAAQWFADPRAHLWELILLAVPLIGLIAVEAIAFGLIWMFTKDFVAPMMAVEDITAGQAWRRLLAMMRDRKADYLLYVVMKAVLTIAFIVGFVILAVVVGLPMVMAAFIVSTVSPLLAVPVIALGVVLAFGAWFLLAAPVAVFFPAYSLHFFAPRHPPLADWMRRFAAPALPTTRPVL